MIEDFFFLTVENREPTLPAIARLGIARGFPVQQ